MTSLPARGTPERQAMIRRAAARVWEGRDDRTFEEAGDYWQSRFEQLVAETVEAIEAEIEKGYAASSQA